MLVLALAVVTMGCENATEPLVATTPTPTPPPTPSNLVVSDAFPADGNATLTGYGALADSGGPSRFVFLSQSVNGVRQRVHVQWTISTDEIVSVGHDWGELTGGTYGYPAYAAYCAFAQCGDHVVLDEASRTVTITDLHLVTGTTTSTLNGTINW
jgi:hypothetical protein